MAAAIVRSNTQSLLSARKPTDHIAKRTQPEESRVCTVQATDYLFKGFSVLGVSMPEQNKVSYACYAFIVNGLVTFILPLAFTLSYLEVASKGTSMEEIGNLLTSVQVAIDVYACSIKIIIMAFLHKKLHNVEPVLEMLDARCSTPEELVHLHKIVRLGRRFVVLFSIAYWSYATSTFLGSVLKGRPPYSLYNPMWDWRESSLKFWSQALIEFILMDVACFQQVVDDSYPVIYVCIIRTHLRLLCERVKKLGMCNEENVEENIEELKKCILDHKNLIELFNIISPVISITIFIQFTITAAILGCTLINILLFATDFSSSVASCFYIIAIVTEVFPLCYYSQCLINDSDHLAEAIFHSNWMGQDARYRKMLIFFMHRSQRRMEFTAGKFFPITLNSFLSIAKFSFSLYTFIKKMDIKDKDAIE